MKNTPLALLWALTVTTSAFAQESKVGKFTVDLAVPEAPAFTVLGLTPQTVVRPSSPQQFATALLSGVDRNGNFQSGFAVDTQPYMLFYGHDVTWDKYRTSYITRFFSRAQVSLDTSKGATEADKSARAAGGLRFTVFDLGDPFRDEVTADCLATAMGNVLQSPARGPPPPPTATATVLEAYQKLKMDLLAPDEEKCRMEQADRIVREV